MIIIKRLHELTEDQWQEWFAARKAVGDKKYQDKHKKRYTLTDIVEELMDALVINDKGGVDRIMEYAETLEDEVKFQYINQMLILITKELHKTINMIRALDEVLPDEICSDEEGGERIWF